MSIASLLRRYPAVDVPGIGVFKRTRYPASYDSDRSTFNPPVEHIELVADQPAHGFPITTYLKAQQQVDEATAVAMLEASVNTLMDTISRNGEALLEGLGHLFADGASFVFKPFEANGLVMEPVAAPLPPDGETLDTEHAGEVIGAELIGADSEEEPVVQPEETEANEAGIPVKRRSPWIMAAAVVVALLIGAGLVWYYQPAGFGSIIAGDVVEHGAGRPDEVKPVISGLGNDSVEVADTAQLTAMAIDADSVQVNTKPEVNSIPAEPSVTYEIIVGSFATMRQADKFVAEMKAKGYDLHAIDSRMPGNRKKISWGSFATEEEAYKELARVQKTFEPGAWIAKIEHQ
ncbi:SPOR domain-containing protein [Parapedobacter soli]|uniref:SPOR domain-containing protein n=1 Tax=Parapedobacter soli TaxID=416955 RepID=UPI0021C90759|nr:SPOR domain-containing protein [Parapedobacter soli]